MTSKLPHGWAGTPLPAPIPWRWAIYNEHEPPPADNYGVIRDQTQETPPPEPSIHVTYWWQIEALLKFEREVAAHERSFLVEANIELRNDE